MANEVQKRNLPWMTPAGETVRSDGVTADELKVTLQKPASTPDIAPIAQRAPIEFITPTTSSEWLRLEQMKNAMPFTTPTGPLPTFMVTRKFLARSNSPMQKALVSSLKNPPPQIPADAVGRMRASMTVVHNLNVFLHSFQQDVERINAIVVGNSDPRRKVNDR